RTLLLKATVLPADAGNSKVKWTSDDNHIAYIDNDGRVRGSTAGIATITCTSVSNPAAKASCKVTVIQRVDGVVLSNASLSVVQNEQVALKGEVYPADASNKTIGWTSGDPSVVSVDQSGKLTAHKRGTTIITATAADGFGAKATCAVRVENVLELDSTVSPNNELFLQGDPVMSLGFVNATYAALERAARRKDQLVWKLTGTGDGAAQVQLTEYPVAMNVDGKDIQFMAPYVRLTALNKAGKDTYTITCTSGNYQESVSFDVKVIDVKGKYGDKATLETTTFN
ncbi:MAG: Ig-like domain-containing protein, partial [Clostridia bacterium]